MKHFSIASKVSFAEVRSLAGEEHWDKDLLDRLDRFLGVAILLTPAVLGPSGLLAFSLVEPKNELIKIGRSLIQRFASATDGDFVKRHRRMTAAYCLITYTAFFSALDLKLPSFAKTVGLTNEERSTIVQRAINRTQDPAAAEAENAATIIEMPHPVIDPAAERAGRVLLYKRMAQAYLRFVQGLAVWDSLTGGQREKLEEATKTVPEQAAEVFDAQYLDLLIEYPAFRRWAEVYEFTKSQQLTADLVEGLQDKIALVAEATQGIDVGLRRLEQLITADPQRSLGNDLVRRITEGLHAEYMSRIEEPVIHDRYIEHDATALVYPRKCDIFVPQAFQAIRYLNPQVRLEVDVAWADGTVNEDLGAFTMRYLDSVYSTESLLLVLGHPGSGKSLLTEMIAARFAPPAYHPIRIELRDIDADTELQDQIERQIRVNTGYEVNWAELADELCDNPPVIILDGYDELLQASGKVFSNYLTRVQNFQRREAVQGRPVRVIVTSRITLIDKAVIPQGITVVRLRDFDKVRRDQWIAVWNSTNGTYFASTGVRPLSIESNSRALHLSAQPLLLLMLAVYDSHSNQLRDADLDRTLLYHSLLVRFIERERTKGDSSNEFMALTSAERREQIEFDLERLGIAAIGMFNRRSLHIARDDLNNDITYFGRARKRDVTHGTPLTQAELLLGSFFFIHESKSQLRDSSPTAFEFMHSTFGEFLTADYILRTVLSETRIIRKLGDDPGLLAMREQHLNQLPPYWFARLIYTSLHTRSVVCSMMREWLPHRLAAERRPPDEFEADFAEVATRQLAEVLRGNVPSAIMQRVSESPFESLPILGHLAVYSLNLVLLWLNLTGADVIFPEAFLGTPLAGCRPWDRLTYLWRSWFSLESLVGLPTALRARRHDGSIILSLPPGEVTKASTKLEDIRNVADALADNITYGLAALHISDLEGAETDHLSAARERLADESVHLSALIDARIGGQGTLWIQSLAYAMRYSGHPEQAEKLYRRSLEISEGSGDQLAMASTYMQLGQALSDMGQLRRAAELYHRGLDILVRLGDQLGVASTYSQLGQVMWRMGDHYEMEKSYLHALDILERLGDRPGIARTYSQLGQVMLTIGRDDKAKDYYLRALGILERSGHELGIAGICHQLGMVAQEQQRLDEAETNYRKALQIRLASGDERSAAATYHQLGMVAQEQQRLDEAETNYRKALQIRLASGDERSAAATYHQLGMVAQEQQRLDEAETNYRKALQIRLASGDERSAAATYHQLGMVAQEQQRLDEAETNYRKALQIRLASGDERSAAATYHQLGMVAQEQQRLDEAETNYRKALQIRLASGDERSAAATYHQLGMVAQEQQRLDEAETNYRKALQIRLASGDERSAAATYHQLGMVAQEQQRLDEAETNYRKARQIRLAFGDEK